MEFPQRVFVSVEKDGDEEYLTVGLEPVDVIRDADVGMHVPVAVYVLMREGTAGKAVETEGLEDS